LVRGDIGQQDRAALQAAFAKDDAWDQWEVREVPLEEEFIRLKRLDAMDRRVGLFENFIDKQHGLAVRNESLDLGSGHRGHKGSWYDGF
jgi:hypothetical protein